MDREKTNSNSEKEWERMGVRVLAAVRQDLYLSMRYLYLALEKMPPMADRRVNWLATDGSHIYYNPLKTVQNWRDDAVIVNRAYLHSVLHALFGHMYRRGDCDVERWNVATDIAVEVLIDGLTFKAVRKLVPDRREQVYRKLTEKTKIFSAERIYEVLENPEFETQIPLYAEWFYVDDHLFWDDRSPEDKSPQERQQEDQERDMWKEMREKTQTEMETYSRTIGMERTRLYQELSRENRERMDYREFLRRFAALREEMRLDLDSFDYGYYQYGMKLYGNMPLIEELEYKEEQSLQEFAIVVDTSGSCSKEVVSRFLQETVSVLEDAVGLHGPEGKSRLRCHIIQCDDQIQDVVTVNSPEELGQYLDSMQIKGRGGTDFRPAFDLASEQKRSGVWKNLRGLLYFTDGYGIYPKQRTDYEAAFLIQEDTWPEGRPPWQSEDFPAWCMHLELPDRTR